MWPVIGGLLGGLGSMFGSMFGSSENASAVAQTNATNVQLQQQNQQFQENMSNTAYQRASADMTKAGLNPAMMFGSGGAASTPSTQPARIEAPQPGQGAIGAGRAVNDMVSNAVQMKTIDKMTEEIANLKTVEAKNIADTAVSGELKQNIAARTGTQYQDTALRRSQSELADHAAHSARNVEEFSNAHPAIRYGSDVAAWLGNKGDAALSPLESVLSSAGAVKRLMPSRSTVQRSRSFLPDGEETFEERWGR